jgi:large subunit ribosomal protein L24
MAKLKLKKGDHVVVISGKDKGKTGAIAHVFPKTNRIIIEGVAVAKRHTRASGGQSSRIIEVSRSIDLSNVMLQDPKDKKATRIGRKVEGGKVVRIAKKSGTTLS